MAADLAKLQAKNEALRATLMALKAPPAAPVAESTKKAESKLKIIALQEKTFAEQQEIERLELEAKQLLARAKEHSRKKKDIEKEIDVVRNADKPVWETVGMQTITYRDPFHTGVSKRTPTGACSSLLSCCAPRVCGPPSVHPPPAYLPRCVTRISTLQAATSRHRAFQHGPATTHSPAHRTRSDYAHLTARTLSLLAGCSPLLPPSLVFFLAHAPSSAWRVHWQ